MQSADSASRPPLTDFLDRVVDAFGGLRCLVAGEGEVYVAVESPRGELGCYLVSDGSANPYRMHIRGPSFHNLQSLPHLMGDSLIADTVAIISSVDPIMGEVDR